MALFLQFAEELATAKDDAEAFARFEVIVRTLGYASVDYASGILKRWPVQTGLDLAFDHYCATFGWQADYVETNFQRYDRCVPFATRQFEPWLYWDLWDLPRTHPVQAEMEAIIQSKVRSGLGVPLFGPGGRFTGVHLGSELPRKEFERLDRETRPIIYLLSAQLNADTRSRAEPKQARVVLSERERECLLWSARGKTAWEISVILSISESAVRKHLGAAATKLDARTRTQAVAAALARGVIAP